MCPGYSSLSSKLRHYLCSWSPTMVLASFSTVLVPSLVLASSPTALVPSLTVLASSCLCPGCSRLSSNLRHSHLCSWSPTMVLSSSPTVLVLSWVLASSPTVLVPSLTVLASSPTVLVLAWYLKVSTLTVLASSPTVLVRRRSCGRECPSGFRDIPLAIVGSTLTWEPINDAQSKPIIEGTI